MRLFGKNIENSWEAAAFRKVGEMILFPSIYLFYNANFTGIAVMACCVVVISIEMICFSGHLAQNVVEFALRNDPLTQTGSGMSFWSFFISQNEIETAAHDLIERHGEGAREEAIRLADVGRRLGAARNSAIFRRAASFLASDQMMAATRAPTDAGRLGKITNLLFEFGSPRLAVKTDANE